MEHDRSPTPGAGPELTEERIASAMARAEKVACSPDDDRCYPFRSSLHFARERCTPKGRRRKQ